MGSDESLNLTNRFELPHSALPDTGSLVRLLYPIILILLSTVYRLGDQLSVSNAIAP